MVEAAPLIVSYGAGTNSVAMLCGMREKGIHPDLILMANTGGELPRIYRHVEQMREWCAAVGFPDIQTVQQVNREGEPITLEQLCIERHMLPSIAYGRKGCSLKHKVYPQEKFVNHWPPAQAAWAKGQLVRKVIGYDADEPWRAKIAKDEKYLYWYPLIDWDWGRDECVAAIERAGLPQPGKSACFFCPSSKQHEILALRRQHPDLLDRAIAMERNADLSVVKGLGRDYAWEQLVDFRSRQIELIPESRIELDCGCYDEAAA
ncbi:phosphoadenosine phosphosulfate reductase [Chitinolyticbacter meiyuanensis]|uniref:phosphoadenosine phosphosulfate reductase n=1 Tax=Chitinolyticbacter meiyuanensis TaxID=682798 RepID=UPI001FE61E68|nr:phosphoadenosine phosphosulfate reductase [Chitinolyticbacter meiyuanensis]